MKIAPDRTFDPVGDLLNIPGAHGFGDKFDDAIAIGGCGPNSGAPCETVDCIAQLAFALQCAAKLAQGIAKAARHRPVRIACGAEQGGTGLIPKPCDPVLHRGIFDDLGFQIFDPRAHFRLVLQADGQIRQHIIGAPTQRVTRILGHVSHELVEPGDDCVADILIKPGPAQDAARALMNHLANDRLIRLDDMSDADDHAVKQRFVPTLAHRGFERLTKQRCDLKAC